MTDSDEVTILSHFDLRKMNSGAISISTPEILAEQLRGLLSPTVSISDSEELRLRLITNGLVASRLRNITPPWLTDLDELLLGEGRFAPTTVAFVQGTHFLKVEDWMFVMAPKVESESDVVMFLSALNRAESEHRGVCYWIFDFSAVTYVNYALIAFLIGFQQNLLCTTPAISLLWLRPEVVPPALLASTKKRFNLFKKGLFLLSEGHSSAEAANV